MSTRMLHETLIRQLSPDGDGRDALRRTEQQFSQLAAIRDLFQSIVEPQVTVHVGSSIVMSAGTVDARVG